MRLSIPSHATTPFITRRPNRLHKSLRVVSKAGYCRAEDTTDVSGCSSLRSSHVGLPRRRAALKKLIELTPLLTTFQEQKFPNNRRPQPPRLRRQTSRHALLPLANSVRIALVETNLLKCGGAQA
jgi:hypothetical protein